jgi:serine/threonine protein kinase
MQGHDPPAARLGRYEIEAELGRGTMGVVYRAYDPDLGRRVALKTIHAALSQVGEERAAFEARFLTEARAAAGLSHPGIVVVHDVGRDPQTGVLFMALEHLAGRPLSALAAEGLPRPWPEALRLAARVAEALHHAHERGVIHRDVKPANIMVLPSGEPKVMDFGIARVDNAQLTSPGEALGTPLYMSPEQALGAKLDARSDVFSLGAVLYLLLTGRNAFAGPNLPAILASVAHADPVPPSRLVDAPEAVDYLVARALAKTAAARYPDARSFGEDLDDVRAGRPPRHRAGWVAPLPRDPAALEALDTAREPATLGASAAPATRTVVTPAAAPARRRLVIALASLPAIALAAWVTWRARAPESAGGLAGALAPTLTLLASPARLEVAFEHSLRSGMLRVWADDELVLEQPLESRVAGKVLFVYKKRRGSVNEALELRPGEHTLRVAVESDRDRWLQRIRGDFESGVTRRLMARLSGGILGRGRDLELFWAMTPSPPAPSE